jgi:MarR family 2-MHQ and catechol resistance regulon transcriptional repressor
MPTHYRGTPQEIQALDAYIKLQRAAETVLAHTSAHLLRYDLTISQFAVLEALYHLGPLSQRLLAAKLLKSTGNISTVLKILEQRGLITRERLIDDNRTMSVSLTPEGQSLLLSFLPQHVAGIVDEMSILTPAELADLARLCRKLGLRTPG